MAKLIQICASQNDLFGLDGDGVVCQYNFNTHQWMELGDARAEREKSSHAESARGDLSRGEGQKAGPQSPTEMPRARRGAEAPVMRSRT
jgi:hypothetical protein